AVEHALAGRLTSKRDQDDFGPAGAVDLDPDAEARWKRQGPTLGLRQTAGRNAEGQGPRYEAVVRRGPRPARVQRQLDVLLDRFAVQGVRPGDRSDGVGAHEQDRLSGDQVAAAKEQRTVLEGGDLGHEGEVSAPGGCRRGAIT